MDIKLKDRVQTLVKIAETGKNLKEFADFVGISQTYLSQIMGEHRRPSLTVAYKIAAGLDSEIEDIFLIKDVAKLHPAHN